MHAQLSKFYPHVQKLLIFSLITFFLATWTKFLTRGLSDSSPAFTSNSVGRSGESSRKPTLNSTLGFQKIFAIALPDRADRVAPLLDAANASEISITVLDAVRDREIPQELWPKNWQGQDHPEGTLGCLTSHIRTWKKIVATGISSAIVMESDVDWDLRIKDIMSGVAEGVNRLIDWPFENTLNTKEAPLQHSSPYGDKWDVIWIGHCAAHDYGNGRIYEIHDPTVPPEDHEYTFGGRPTDDQHKPGTRIMFQLRGVICAYAYAVSYQGAKKMLKHVEEDGTNLPADFFIGSFCNEKADIACAGVWPQVMTAASTASNIAHGDGAVTSNANDASPGPALQYSARFNSKLVLDGGTRADWIPQWNTTWAMKDGEWSLVSFEEAEALAKAEKHP